MSNISLKKRSGFEGFYDTPLPKLPLSSAPPLHPSTLLEEVSLCRSRGLSVA